MTLERMAAGALAGAGAGVLCGIGARLAMRSVALGLLDPSMQVPIFTFQGTLFILMIGAIVGTPFGVGYALLHGVLGGPRPLRGLLYAAIMLAAFGPMFFLGGDEFTSTGRVLAFLTLFPIFGVGVPLALPVAERAAASLPRYAHVAALVGAAGGTALIAFGVVGLVIGSLGTNGPAALGLVATWPALIAIALLMRRSRSTAPAHTT